MKNPLLRLKIRARLFFILIAFLIPIGVLSYQLNAKLTEAINFSQKESHGTSFIKPLVHALNMVSDYQDAYNSYVSGDASGNAEMLSLQKEMDTAIAELEKLNATIGIELDFTPEGLKAHGQNEVTVANLKQKWSALIAKNEKTSDDFTQLINDLASMIKHAGDTSNLILDGDLDTYYLMDAGVGALPAFLQKLADVKNTGFTALHSGGGKLDEKSSQAILLNEVFLVESLLPRVKDDINTALKEDANFQGTNAQFQSEMPKLLSSFEEETKKLAEIMLKLSQGHSMNADDFVTAANSLHDQAEKLAETSLSHLGSMIDVRVDALKDLRLRVMSITAAFILLAFVLFYIISGSISKPVKGMTETMKRLADGDTSVEVPSTENGDEVGEMAKTVLVFKENMIQTERMRAEQEAQKKRAEEEKRATMHAMASSFESSVKSVVTGVSASATQMRGNAEKLSSLASETKITSASVASAATEAAQTATQVAAAAEELTAAIGEISSQVQKSSTVANQASSQAESINQSMHLLVEKSNRVGEVIQFITNIASQINLLALNATIESARAGEAGRGFAVVASEVKNLANQTAKATEEIVQQVQSMQEATHEAVQSVGQIISIIGEISASTAGVAAAVEEQSAATNEISRNITHTAAGTNEISRSIVSVEKGADETGISSKQVLDSATELSSQSELLKQKVDEFLQTVRNA